MNWERSECRSYEYKRKYQLVIMDSEGKTTYGRTFDSWSEMFEAMMELRNIYAKNEINHHVGFREV